MREIGALCAPRYSGSLNGFSKSVLAVSPGKRPRV